MTDSTEFRLYESDADEGSWKRQYNVVAGGDDAVELRSLSDEADADEAWRHGVAREDAEEARKLDAMSEQQLDAELAEELGPVKRWIQEHVAQAEFSNELFPDLLDFDEARHALDNGEGGQEPPV